jgi:hypothetical protein
VGRLTQAAPSLLARGLVRLGCGNHLLRAHLRAESPASRQRLTLWPPRRWSRPPRSTPGLASRPKRHPAAQAARGPGGSPWRSPLRGTAAIRAAHAGAAARGGSAPAPAGLASGRVRPGIGWRGDATPSLPFSYGPAYVLPHPVEAAGRRHLERRHLELHASPGPAVNGHSIGRAVSIACSLHSSAWPSTTPTSSAPRLWKGWSGHPCPTRIACRRLKGVEQVVNLTSKTLKVRLLAFRN